ncbi:hypothetical protein SAMN05443661_11711 [Natronobacterium gregoryi]|uniref:Uncharacterized protein n=3 Tax=Natronobacterium gregoryi TaxID=44930 RepID=L0ADI3_NATGS|nr:hypothetical protein Natgr_0731 [Natronobacterium gregoryi SP2]SFJ19304.1 hypothetical protein SAMN05443661_11711 [Natronobacterium gregoryi]
MNQLLFSARSSTFIRCWMVDTPMTVDLNEFEHPSWAAAAGTIAGYLLVLVLLTVALFIVPWLVFLAL